MRTAVGNEDVVYAVQGASVDLVAISLLPFRIDERFRVGEADGASGPAAHLHNRISIGRVRLVEQDRRSRSCGDEKIARAAQERVVRLNTARSTEGGEPLFSLFHCRNRPRLELPP